MEAPICAHTGCDQNGDHKCNLPEEDACALDQFLSSTYSEIRESIADFACNNNIADLATDVFCDNEGLRYLVMPEDVVIVLDIEHPRHPKDFGRDYYQFGEGGYTLVPHLAEEFQEVIQAFQRRIDAAQSVFVGAEIALYGVVVPKKNLDTSFHKWQQMMAGYMGAGSFGLYDNLDLVCPILYFREDENIYQNDERNVVIRARNAIHKTQEITSQYSVGMFPLMTFKKHKDPNLEPEPADIGALRDLVCMLREEDVRTFGIWHGAPDGEMWNNSPNYMNVFDYYRDLFLLGDYDTDGDIDADDQNTFNTLFQAGDYRADLTDDGVVDNDDAVLFQQRLNSGDTLVDYCGIVIGP